MSDGQKHSSTALAPLLWLTGIVAVPALAVLLRNPTAVFLQVFCSFAVGVPVAATIWAYRHFALTDPDRLHSESFQIRKQSLGIVETKGGKVPMLPASLEAMSNPFPADAQKKLHSATVDTPNDAPEGDD